MTLAAKERWCIPLLRLVMCLDCVSCFEINGRCSAFPVYLPRREKAIGRPCGDALADAFQVPVCCLRRGQA